MVTAMKMQQCRLSNRWHVLVEALSNIHMLKSNTAAHNRAFQFGMKPPSHRITTLNKTYNHMLMVKVFIELIVVMTINHFNSFCMRILI